MQGQVNIDLNEEQLKQMAGVAPGQTAGQVNMMGINIDIASTIGGMLADQYIAQLTPENMKILMDFITQDLFKSESRYDYTEGISKEILSSATFLNGVPSPYMKETPSSFNTSSIDNTSTEKLGNDLLALLCR